MATFERTTLRNGTRVILVPHADTQAATLLVQYEVGSRYETAKLSGAAHFIEHMMFKGTSARASTMVISRDLDAVGADSNAFTGKDYTGYYIRLQAEKLPFAVDVLSDLLHNSLFREKDLLSERKVIHEEIRMYEDNPMSLVDELLDEELFDGSTLARKISGTVETMNGIARGPMVAFKDAYYIPSRTVISVAGRFDRNVVLPLLEKTFGARPNKKGGPAFTSFPALSASKAAKAKAPRVRIHTKETEQVQVAIGWPSYQYGHKMLPALNLLSVILGGNMSSRLFLSVRERQGLAYFIRSSSGPYQDTGSFTIQAGLAKSKVHQALKTIMRETGKFTTTTVSNAELTRAKEYIKGKMLLHLEDSSHLADWYAKQELLQHKVTAPEERLKQLFAVTKEDILAAAREILHPERTAIAVVGPYTTKDAPAFAAHVRKW